MKTYNINGKLMVPTGWTGEAIGYNVDDYFDSAGRYKGPDIHGIEPTWEPAYSSQIKATILTLEAQLPALDIAEEQAYLIYHESKPTLEALNDRWIQALIARQQVKDQIAAWKALDL
jgi:hypothetical protein